MFDLTENGFLGGVFSGPRFGDRTPGNQRTRLGSATTARSAPARLRRAQVPLRRRVSSPTMSSGMNASGEPPFGRFPCASAEQRPVPGEPDEAVLVRRSPQSPARRGARMAPAASLRRSRSPRPDRKARPPPTGLPPKPPQCPPPPRPTCKTGECRSGSGLKGLRYFYLRCGHVCVIPALYQQEFRATRRVVSRPCAPASITPSAADPPASRQRSSAAARPP